MKIAVGVISSCEATRLPVGSNSALNQHHVQQAYLKSFEDESGKLWVYPKHGGKPRPRPAKYCAAKEDFQSEELEFLQNRLVETPGIKALRATGFLSEDEYSAISSWMALHVLRNPRSRFELFSSRDDYDARFREEFEKELLFSAYYRHVFTYLSDTSAFLTSDNPVIEFAVEGEFVRCCSISPTKMILFSPINDRPTHELPVEDMFNSLLWGNTVEYLFSRRPDASMEKLKDIAETYAMFPIEQDISFQFQSGSGEESQPQ